MKNTPAKFCKACGGHGYVQGPSGTHDCDCLKTKGQYLNPQKHTGGDIHRLRPKIICLCGSTRFIEDFAILTWELEQLGNIVLGCTLLPSRYCPVPDHYAEHMGGKEKADALHQRKIDLADEIYVLNYEGYIGESTRSEIEYATSLGKPISYMYENE